MDNVKVRDFLCEKCIAQKEKLYDYVEHKKNVTLVTLGPDGTTSSEAAKVFKRYIEGRDSLADLTILLHDSFELALEEIHKKSADFILLPNAYGKMTHFYWDTTIELGFVFTNRTPVYGIAAMDANDLSAKSTVLIATCKAVEHLLQELMETTVFKDKKYSIVEANSTTKSLMLLEEGKVDLALTNDTSLKSGKVSIISKTKQTDVLWSIFMLKKY